MRDEDAEFDVIVVGAGFAGLYLLYRLRELGLSARAYEAGDNVGGTWYWNRYPGARCDAESLAYSFSFSPELEQTWEWTERYATQPEILRYAEHVADRFDLRRDIRFERRVTAAHFDGQTSRWQVETDQGDRASAWLCIMATGCLSVPQIPDIPGLDSFSGPVYQASLWPHDSVSFDGLRLGIIGTGSSAIQAIPVLAREAGQLYVFQRTPNFSVPARNTPLDPDWVARFKRNYRQHRALHRTGQSAGFGDLEIEARPRVPAAETGRKLDQSRLEEILEKFWHSGGACFASAVADTVLDPQTNERVAEFVRRKIRQTVRDPAVAETLCPQSHPIATKRICVDIDYYETFNRDNVTLVDVARDPIVEVTAQGVRTRNEHYPLDALVLATGFDAMTGALLRIDVRGRDGVRLRDRWAAGPRSYLGIGIEGFPNLFTVTGPGSPSVLSNMLVSIEQHVDWMIECIAHMQRQGLRQIEPEAEAEAAWMRHVNDVANATLYPRGGSWYLGANVPGKPRVFMPYAGGVGAYREICDDVVADGYRGFRMTP